MQSVKYRLDECDRRDSTKPWKLKISGWSENVEFSPEIRSLCGETGLVKMVRGGVFISACRFLRVSGGE